MAFTKTQIGIAIGAACLLVFGFVGYLWWLSDQGPVLARSEEKDSLTGLPLSIKMNPLRDRSTEKAANKFLREMREGLVCLRDHRRVVFLGLSWALFLGAMMTGVVVTAPLLSNLRAKMEKSGKIKMAECFQCLDCQVEYYDDKRCPPLVQATKLRGEKRPVAVTAESA